MTRQLAELAIASTADVFTPKGDAVVIERLTGGGGLPIVVGERHDQVSTALPSLT